MFLLLFVGVTDSYYLESQLTILNNCSISSGNNMCACMYVSLM